MKVPVLYLSHDGVMEPLGESQVLAYLERLAATREFEISLISFEKKKDWSQKERRDLFNRRLNGAGIHWHPLRYHNRPPLLGTIFDLSRALLLAWRLHAGTPFRLVHARSYPMALLALALRRSLSLPFIFDMRGFWADERAESGNWKRNGFLYRFFKCVEKRCLIRASAVVSLTEAAVMEMKTFSYLQGRQIRFAVIPTCADLALFEASEVPGGRFTLGYVGSTGLWYDFSPLARVFRFLREIHPSARFQILTRDPEGPLREQLSEFPPEAVEIRPASRKEVAEAMQKMHLTAFFLRPSYAKKASMPTRLAEFLGCGVPCLTNQGCGDIEEIFKRREAGAAVADHENSHELRIAVGKVAAMAMDAKMRAACRATAEAEFSLEAGMAVYADLYREIAATKATVVCDPSRSLQ